MFGFNFLEPGKVILFWLPGMATVREESVRSTRNPKPETINYKPKPQTLDPKPSTLNLKPQTLNPEP